jgi:hypothetical protein
MNISTVTKLITTPLSERLVRAAMRMMRPIVRMFAPYMTINVFLDLCERVYIEQCDRMLKQPNLDPATRARISANIGYNTEAMKELIQTPAYFTDQDICIEGMILSTWLTENQFRDSNGEPAVLKVVGPGRTFQALVKRAAGKEVPVLDVLDILISRGNVERVYPDGVRLLSPFYEVLDEDEEPYIDIGSLAIANLTNTVLHNMANRSHSDRKRFQRQRWSTNLPLEQVQTLRTKMTALLRDQVRDSNALINEHEDPNVDSYNTMSIGVGYYMWEQGSDAEVNWGETQDHGKM